MNDDEDEENNNKLKYIKDELFLLQCRTQKDISNKDKQIKMNKQKNRFENEISLIIQVLPIDRTIIEKQKLINFFKYTKFFEKMLKKNSIEKIQIIIEKCVDRIHYRYINKGDTVYKYMEKADQLYFIISGEASVLIPKKYEQIEDEKQNKIQLQKNNSISSTSNNQINSRQQQYILPTIKSVGSNQISNLTININPPQNNQQQYSDFRINSLVDIPYENTTSRDLKKQGSNIQSPIRSSRMKRNMIMANQQQSFYFFQDGIEDSPKKSIDSIRKLNSMSLIQEMEGKKNKTQIFSPRKIYSSSQNNNNFNNQNSISMSSNININSPEKNNYYIAINNSEKRNSNGENNKNIQQELKDLVDISNISNEQYQCQKGNLEMSHNSLISDEMNKANQNNNNNNSMSSLRLNLFPVSNNIQPFDHKQSYLKHGEQQEGNNQIVSFSQLPFEENDIISEKSEKDSVMNHDSNNRTPQNEMKIEEKKLSNLEKVFMSEPEFQNCFGSLYPHEINNCALQYFDGNIFKYFFGQRLKENHNTDTIDIIQKQPRSTTCVALTSLQLASLDKNDYNEMLKDFEEVNLWRKVDAICKSFDVEKIPNLRKMIADIFPFLQKVTFQRGQTIFQEGDYTKGCYIIKKGEIELTKWSMIEPPQDFQNENQFRNWQSFCYPQEILLSNITQGQFFGEDDMLRNRKYRLLNAKCKSSECKLYFINKIHFLRILYESNIVVDIFEGRAKLKDKWHKSKYEKMIQILNEDYSKRLGRNLFEEKKKEILGQKGEEEIEKEKQEYRGMTGMFRDTYEKMIWKMSVQDELNFPFKQKNADEDQKNQNEKINGNENLKKIYQNKKSIQSRSNSTDQALFYDGNTNNPIKNKIKQYGRLIVQKGSKQTFLEEKMNILENIQERQMRYLLKKKGLQQQQSQQDKQLQKTNNNLSERNTQSKQNIIRNSEEIQDLSYTNNFSKIYNQWKKRSASSVRIKPSFTESNTDKKDDIEKNKNISLEDNTPIQQEILSNIEPQSNSKIIKTQLNKQRNSHSNSNSKKDSTFITNNVINLNNNNSNSNNNNNLDVKIIINENNKMKQKQQELQNQNILNNEQDQSCQSSTSSSDENEQEKQEKQQQLLSMLTCKIQGYQGDLQTEFKNKKIKEQKNKNKNEDQEDDKKLPIDFKIKTARSQAQAIQSHFMSIMEKQQEQQKQKKYKKVKKNKLDIIEYRLKGQVWAVMQMKRELAKFEIKNKLTHRNDKTQQKQRSISSIPIQQRNDNITTDISQSDSKFHNIFKKIKNQVIEIQKEKYNKDNIYIPAFSVFPYANNAEYILSHPLLNTNADKSYFTQPSQDQLKQQQINQNNQQIVQQQQESISHISQPKYRSKTEEIQSRQQINKISNQNDLDKIMMNTWNKVISDVQVQDNNGQENKKQIQNNHNALLEYSQNDQEQTLFRSNSIQLIENNEFINSSRIIQTNLKQNDNNLIQNQQQSYNLRNNSAPISQKLNQTYSSQLYLNQEKQSIHRNNQFKQQQKQNDVFQINKNLNQQDKSFKNTIVNYHTPQKTKSRINRSLTNQTLLKSQNNNNNNEFIPQRQRIISEFQSTNSTQFQIIKTSQNNLGDQIFQEINKNKNIYKIDNQNEFNQRNYTNQFNDDNDDNYSKPTNYNSKKTITQQNSGKKNDYNKMSSTTLGKYISNDKQYNLNSITLQKNNKDNITQNIDTNIKDNIYQDIQINNLSQHKNNNNNSSFRLRSNHSSHSQFSIQKDIHISNSDKKLAINSSNLSQNNLSIINNQQQQQQIQQQQQQSYQQLLKMKQSNLNNNNQINEALNQGNLNYLKKVNIQTKPKSLVVINHQGKPITYQFK